MLYIHHNSSLLMCVVSCSHSLIWSYPFHHLSASVRRVASLLFFFFNDTATTEIYTLSLHDALPICPLAPQGAGRGPRPGRPRRRGNLRGGRPGRRSEEHTSELQSHLNLVCRLLLEKKKRKHTSGGVVHHVTDAVHPPQLQPAHVRRVVQSFSHLVLPFPPSFRVCPSCCISPLFFF